MLLSIYLDLQSLFFSLLISYNLRRVTKPNDTMLFTLYYNPRSLTFSNYKVRIHSEMRTSHDENKHNTSFMHPKYSTMAQDEIILLTLFWQRTQGNQSAIITFPLLTIIGLPNILSQPFRRQCYFPSSQFPFQALKCSTN